MRFAARVVWKPEATNPGPFTWQPVGKSTSLGYVIDAKGARVMGINLSLLGERVPYHLVRRRCEWLLDALNTAWNIEQTRKANEAAYGPGGTKP